MVYWGNYAARGQMGQWKNVAARGIIARYMWPLWGHGQCKFLSGQVSISDKYVKFTNFEDMPTKKKDNEPGSEDFETLKLKKRIAELEKQLQTAEMKAIAFSTMVDIAEKEFNIPIRKKYNTKP